MPEGGRPAGWSPTSRSIAAEGLALQAALGPAEYKLLVSVVCDDAWVWEHDGSIGEDLSSRGRISGKSGSAARQLATRKMAHALHRLLDRTGVTLGYQSEIEFRRRWATQQSIED